jgi:uncharacterized protein
MDEQALERLRDAASSVLESRPVAFAYLFGSAATGKEHAASDVDVAVRLEDSVPQERYLGLRLELAGELVEASGIGGIEVLVLNEAPLPLRGRAVRERIGLYSRDERARVRFESLTMREFMDFEIHAGPMDEGFLRDIAAGRR